MFDNSELVCSLCLQKERKQKIKPLCKGRNGCPVEDIAPNKNAEKIVSGFIEAKLIFRATNSTYLYEKMLKKIGILEHVDLIFEFEHIWLEHQVHQINQRKK